MTRYRYTLTADVHGNDGTAHEAAWAASYLAAAFLAQVEEPDDNATELGYGWRLVGEATYEPELDPPPVMAGPAHLLDIDTHRGSEDTPDAYTTTTAALPGTTTRLQRFTIDRDGMTWADFTAHGITLTLARATHDGSGVVIDATDRNGETLSLHLWGITPAELIAALTKEA